MGVLSPGGVVPASVEAAKLPSETSRLSIGINLGDTVGLSEIIDVEGGEITAEVWGVRDVDHDNLFESIRMRVPYGDGESVMAYQWRKEYDYNRAKISHEKEQLMHSDGMSFVAPGYKVVGELGKEEVVRDEEYPFSVWVVIPEEKE